MQLSTSVREFFRRCLQMGCSGGLNVTLQIGSGYPHWSEEVTFSAFVALAIAASWGAACRPSRAFTGAGSIAEQGVAKIDWNRIDSRFVEDYVYEHINAPKWVHFLAIDHPSIVDDDDDVDDVWFCTPGFSSGLGLGLSSFQGSTKSKLPISGTESRIQSSVFSKVDDNENQNPNLSTSPPNQQANSLKAAIKSSSERKKPTVIDDISQPRVKLATRARERETEEKKIQGEEAVVEKERKPLLEKPVVMQNGIDIAKERERIKESRTHESEAEDIAPPLSLNLENVKNKDKELLQIRVNPPSPQCFSAPIKTTTPSKAPISKVTEMGFLQEVKQNKDTKTDKPRSRASTASAITNVDVTDGSQARALDVFWFLEPCTLSE
ncbi:hypothetical protein F3Y22_tig00004013pilonHSYRG00035 [Hibiscus syriacus]|uniref:Uncharacterized protein n=1 Tax=Hibiscus syriacus TaxID=106335 RepID=A0A6A3CIK9_HIBSY|nr:hypothetical protein F3Y22_tig00004013pilonHSYRG00035 [Hibiscus syriacus]